MLPERLDRVFMPKRGDREFLIDILEALNRIDEYTSGLDYQGFLGDIKIGDAVLRN